MTFEKHWSGQHGFVAAFIDGREVGILTLRQAESQPVQIVFIHVEEAHRRKGVGTAMAKEAVEMIGQTKAAVDLITGMGRSIALSDRLAEEIPELEIEIHD
jgi:ribosomal protein S18 acetylase RimI-like enzyme